MEINILKAVAYFDVFKYPLTIQEIVDFLDVPADENNIHFCIQHLIEIKALWNVNGFYSIRNDPGLAARRRKGNELAIAHIKKSIRIAHYLYWIPFVKGIAISGSLSKNYADENSDFDFFIITAANRLWIVRFFYTILFKMATLFRVRHWFCLNYFIDESGLEIAEHNIFTAVELITLKPVKGKAVQEAFLDANQWAYEFLPNGKTDFRYLKEAKINVFRKLSEWFINLCFGDKLNDMLLRFFRRHFEKELSKKQITDKGIMIGAFEATQHACKPMPQYFQPKILVGYQEKFQQALNNYYQLDHLKMFVKLKEG